MNERSGKALAIASWWGGFWAGPIAPLVIFLTSDGRPGVRSHARSSLVYWVVALAVWLPYSVITFATGNATEVYLVVGVLLMSVSVVVCVVGTVQVIRRRSFLGASIELDASSRDVLHASPMTARASLLISLLVAGAGIAAVVLLTQAQLRAVLLPVPLIAATYLHRYLQATYGVEPSDEPVGPSRFSAFLHNENWRHEHPLVFSALMALGGAGLLAGLFALDGTLSEKLPAVVALLCILPIVVRLGLVYEESTK